MKKILQKEASVLREISKEVPIEKIPSEGIKAILEEMKTALDTQDDGVAIAAPQIGYSLRIFVISKKVEDMIKKGRKDKPGSQLTHKAKATIAQNTVFINPIIKKISKEKRVVEEGCLSVRYLYGKVSRASKVIIEAYNENGNKFTEGATGLLAQIFQHEVDHLNGTLFIDKAKYIEEIIPEHLNNSSKKIKNEIK